MSCMFGSLHFSLGKKTLRLSLWTGTHSVFSFFFQGILRNSEDVPEDEENFEEAIKAANTALEPTLHSVPHSFHSK